MKLTLLAVGKLRDVWVKQGCEEYARRLGSKLPLEIIEVKSADDLPRRTPPRHRLWVLDQTGVQHSSNEMATVLGRAMAEGNPGWSFWIGGAEGLSAPLLARADALWSFGRLTLPHRLVRLILLEQLYRAISMVRGEPYHRA